MLYRTLLLVFALTCVASLQAQEEPQSNRIDTAPAAEESDVVDKLKDGTEKLKETAIEWEEKTAEEVSKIAKKVDQDPLAKSTAAGILQPIYTVAEKLSFPAFHWVAFTLMAAGVVSFALQLALGKLVVLTRMGLSFKEIASDAVGLAISVIGLVLTTQAAAENSTFTQSAAAVISASVVGAAFGFVLYLWGQSQELQAVAGRSQPVRK